MSFQPRSIARESAATTRSAHRAQGIPLTGGCSSEGKSSIPLMHLADPGDTLEGLDVVGFQVAGGPGRRDQAWPIASPRQRLAPEVEQPDRHLGGCETTKATSSRARWRFEVSEVVRPILNHPDPIGRDSLRASPPASGDGVARGRAGAGRPPPRTSPRPPRCRRHGLHLGEHDLVIEVVRVGFHQPLGDPFGLDDERPGLSKVDPPGSAHSTKLTMVPTKSSDGKARRPGRPPVVDRSRSLRGNAARRPASRGRADNRHRPVSRPTS